MRYEAPDTLERAVALLSAGAGTTRVLAGGTDVLVQLRSGLVEPDLIVDIKRIGGVFDIARFASPRPDAVTDDDREDGRVLIADPDFDGTVICLTAGGCTVAAANP